MDEIICVFCSHFHAHYKALVYEITAITKTSRIPWNNKENSFERLNYKVLPIKRRERNRKNITDKKIDGKNNEFKIAQISAMYTGRNKH